MVRNHAAHGPDQMFVKEEERGGTDIKPMPAEDAKPKWSTRVETGETDKERTGPARAVPRRPVIRIYAAASSSRPLARVDAAQLSSSSGHAGRSPASSLGR